MVSHPKLNLDITISSDLTVTEHINEIHNKTIHIFGFLQRNCWEFHDSNCLYSHIREKYETHCFIIFSCTIDFGKWFYNLKPPSGVSYKKIRTNPKSIFRMFVHKTSDVDLPLQSLAIQFNIEQLEFRTQFNDLRWLRMT